MKKINWFNIFWTLPQALLFGIILSFSFDYRLGILVGAYIFFNDLRFEQLNDELNMLKNK